MGHRISYVVIPASDDGQLPATEQAQCSCGWKGWRRDKRDDAAADAAAHAALHEGIVTPEATP